MKIIVIALDFSRGWLQASGYERIDEHILTNYFRAGGVDVMEGLLAKRCLESFDAGDRHRGEEYVRDSLVELVSVGDLGAQALASGSDLYNIFLSFKSLPEDVLEVHCDCPRFAKGMLCKHVWASIRMVDARVPISLSRRNKLEVDAFDPDAFELGQPVQVAWPGKVAVGASSLSVAKRHSPVMALPSWQNKLASAYRVSGVDRELPGDLTALHSIPASRYWFAISLADQANSERFQIHLYESKTKKDGDWSIPTKVSIRRSSLSAIRDPVARRVLAMLDWDLEQGHGFQSYVYEHRTLFGIHTELCSETLQALCESQRFVWNYTDGKSLLDYQTIHADVASPWQFLVRIEPGPTPQTLRVAPGLQRNTDASSVEFRGIERVVAVCDSGAVLFEESMGVVRASEVGWLRGWQREGSFEIPHEELESFLKAFLGWNRQPQLEIDERLGITQVGEKPVGKLLLNSARYELNYLTAEIYFKYGDVSIRSDAACEAYWSDEQKTLGLRDRHRENALLQDLAGFPISESYFGKNEFELKIHRKWFSELVRKLVANAWEVIAHGKLHRSASNFDIRVSSGQDWFDLNAKVNFAGQQIALPTLLLAVRRGEKFVVLDDGSHGLLPEKWLEQFADLTEVGEVQGEAVRFRRNQALMLDMLLAEQPDASIDRDFSDWCQRLKNFSGIRPAKQPRGFRGELRSYQQEGLGWFRFLNEFEFGGCLADDMGLGKTIQVLALLEGRRTRKLAADEVRKPSIVIVPKSLVFNWIDEAAKFAPKLKIVDYTGTDRAAQLAAIEQCDLVVTTYATFRLDVARLKDIAFDYAILDEAQAIKNPSAQATKAVRLLQADHRLAMTGTPIENHLGDLWSLFDFLNPGMLGKTTASSFSLSTDEDNHRIEALSNALRPFILRRTKDQVLTELPEKTEQTLYCELSPKQKKLYNELRDHYRISLTAKVKELGIQRAKIHVLEALLRLRQAACDPRLIDPKQSLVGTKIELLMEQLSDVVAEGHKILIFSQFTSLLALVKKEIEAKRWTHEYLDGKTSKRAERVKRFQEDADCSLFLISLKAGGLGLNLTAAEYVYILDPWWNPAAEAQAIDRAHRLGQQKPVIAYRMIARGTVEDKIVQLQQSKRQLADAVISADQSLLRKLSMNDLQVLFE